jgi:hypothetical protein
MTLLVREYTYNNFLRKLASECILIEMSGRVGQIKVKAPVLSHVQCTQQMLPVYEYESRLCLSERAADRLTGSGAIACLHYVYDPQLTVAKWTDWR